MTTPHTIEHLKENIEEIERRIGHRFIDLDLLVLAFIHRSYVNEHKDAIQTHNERLEFLGDSVLGVIVSNFLYNRFPEWEEGELSENKAHLVDANACIKYVQALDLSTFLVLGRGESLNAGKGRETVLSDLFEGVIGAIFLDAGLEVATRFIMDNLLDVMFQILEEPIRNWKALLQDHVQKSFHLQPVYEVIRESGPDHEKTFEVQVSVNDESVAKGKGVSKKMAQQAAAKQALIVYGVFPN